METNIKSFRPWSYSRMATARECSYLFKRQRVDGVIQPTSSMMRVGTAVHEVLARYGLHCTRAKRQTDYEAMDRIISECRNMVVSAEEKDAVRTMCLKFAETRLIDENWIFESRVAVDAEWQPCDYDSPDCYFRGRVDCYYIDGEDNLVIVDYYSGHHRPDEFLKKDQLRHYALALFQLYPDIDDAVCFTDFLRYGGSDSSVEFRTNRHAVEHIKHEIAALDSRYLQEREFAPTPNENCQWCYLRRECPAMIDAMKNLPAPEADAQQLWLLKNAADDINDRLKGEEFGSWRVGDMVLATHSKSSDRYDFTKLVNILMRRAKGDQAATEMMQDTIYKVIESLSSTDVKKIVGMANKSGLLAKKLSLEDLKDAKFVKSGTEFKFKNEQDATPILF